MISKLDKAFAFNEAALSLRATRQEVIASNIANADTPNYKARDFDFGATLGKVIAGQTSSGLQLAKSDARHLDGYVSNPLEAQLMYRNDIQPSIDGNTVDMNTEMSNFTDNAIRYQASITFMQQRLAGMRTALQSQ